jgi:hypothetical protein
MYQLQPDTSMGAATCIKRIADNAFIPFDPANTDYQEYLKWLAEGNLPIPADAGEGNAPIGADDPLPAEEIPTTNTQE